MLNKFLILIFCICAGCDQNTISPPIQPLVSTADVAVIETRDSGRTYSLPNEPIRERVETCTQRLQYVYLFANNGDLVLVSVVNGILGFIVESHTYSWLDANNRMIQWNGELLVSATALAINHEPILREP